jgi:hypothetical protein
MRNRCLAGLLGIPDVFREAASVGGAGGWMLPIVFFDLINGPYSYSGEGALFHCHRIDGARLLEDRQPGALRESGLRR